MEQVALCTFYPPNHHFLPSSDSCMWYKVTSVVSNSLQLYELEPTRLLYPWDGILHPRILEWIAMSSSRQSS